MQFGVFVCILLIDHLSSQGRREVRNNKLDGFLNELETIISTIQIVIFLIVTKQHCITVPSSTESWMYALREQLD